MEQYIETDEGKPKSFCATKKAHRTLFEKKFLISRAGWKVIKLYSHYSFDQERFKINFMLINQKSRQNAKNSIEK